MKIGFYYSDCFVGVLVSVGFSVPSVVVSVLGFGIYTFFLNRNV